MGTEQKTDKETPEHLDHLARLCGLHFSSEIVQALTDVVEHGYGQVTIDVHAGQVTQVNSLKRYRSEAATAPTT